jgi:hypothetical protein
MMGVIEGVLEAQLGIHWRLSRHPMMRGDAVARAEQNGAAIGAGERCNLS